MTDLTTTAELARAERVGVSAILMRAYALDLAPAQVRGNMHFWSPEQVKALSGRKRGRPPGSGKAVESLEPVCRADDAEASEADYDRSDAAGASLVLRSTSDLS